MAFRNDWVCICNRIRLFLQLESIYLELGWVWVGSPCLLISEASLFCEADWQLLVLSSAFYLFSSQECDPLPLLQGALVGDCHLALSGKGPT